MIEEIGKFPAIKSEHYFNRYLKLISTYIDQTVDGYCENHHIVPKCYGGTNSKSNMIVLTARQHFLAHWMLWKALSGNKMAFAFNMICNGANSNHRPNSRAYESFRKAFSESISGKNHHQYGKPLSEETKRKMSLACMGRKHTEESKKKMSESRKGEKSFWFGKFGKDHPTYGRKIPEEHKEKLRTLNTGRVVSQDTRDKLSKAMSGKNNHRFGIDSEDHPMWGRKHSVETRRKISEALKEIGHPSSRKVINLDTAKIFYSIKEAGAFYNIKAFTHIGSVCRGERNLCGGYHWQYYEDYLAAQDIPEQE